MISVIYNLTYKEPPIDQREALRYAGVRGDDRDSAELLSECYLSLLPRLGYRVCYREMDISEPLPSRMLAGSEGLRTHLAGASRIIIFAATLGIEPDRAVARAAVGSARAALMYQAIGAERIEALCDAFSLEMKEKYSLTGALTTSRFSPGYGDLSLECQRDIFALLDCERQIGVSLGERLLMTPTKSVTAIIGIKDAR